MELVSGMLAFVRAAETRSFTRAAQSLGVTSSGVGKAVSRLEAELGVRLLERTTRRVALTDEGAVFIAHCRRVLEEIDAARSSLAERSAAPRGRLRVSLPSFLGPLLIPELARFNEANPEVLLDVGLTDRRVNLVDDGVDVAVRVGELQDSSLVARRLGEAQLVTVASPALALRVPLGTLGDLAVAPAVTFRQPTTGRERPWSFTVEGRALDWLPRARVVIDDGTALVSAAVAGLGVTQVLDRMAAGALASGALVEVLSSLRARPLPIHALHVAGRPPPRTRAFLDFLARISWRSPTWALASTPRRRARAEIPRGERSKKR